MQIEKTARGSAKDLGSNQNVTPMVMSMKRIEVLPGYVPKGKRAVVGREKWEVEFDGLGNVEVSVEIPAVVNRLKDAAKRAARVKALVIKTAMAEGEALLANHS